MSDRSKIEWCDTTWNVVTGCAKVSQGCKHCYAEVIAKRFWGGRKFTDVMVHPERLGQPLSWRKPRRVFVNSMSDLFHEAIPMEFIARVWAVMMGATGHRFMVLTKRPERMREFVTNFMPYAFDVNLLVSQKLKERPAKNIWLGVSAETQEEADRRIPILLQTPAAVRFISAEPLLENVNLLPYLVPIGYNWDYERRGPARINWVVVGGESGTGARPMAKEWVRAIRDQCQAADVPFFFKQWGEWAPYLVANCSAPMHLWEAGKGASQRCGKRRAGRLMDGIEWNQEPTR